MKLQELLSEHENIVVHIKSRLNFLIEFEKQLKEVTKGKQFLIRNDIVWRSIFDTWDVVVIDFASLSRGMLGESGFFNQFKANLNELKQIKKRDIVAPRGSFTSLNPITQEDLDRIEIELETDFIEIIYTHGKAQFYELFPNAKTRPGGKVNHKDIDDLKLRFEKIVTDVITDRDTNRAHRYENLNNKSGIGKMTFDLLKLKFDELETLLNNIRGVLARSSFAFNDTTMVTKSEAAKDYITAILWGTLTTTDIHMGINDQLSSPPNPNKKYGYQIRKLFLEERHRIHDEHIAKYSTMEDSPQKENALKICFNDLNLKENK